MAWSAIEKKKTIHWAAVSYQTCLKPLGWGVRCLRALQQQLKILPDTCRLMFYSLNLSSPLWVVMGWWNKNTKNKQTNPKVEFHWTRNIGQPRHIKKEADSKSDIRFWDRGAAKMWERQPTVLAGDGISKMILRGWGLGWIYAQILRILTRPCYSDKRVSDFQTKSFPHPSLGFYFCYDVSSWCVEVESSVSMMSVKATETKLKQVSSEGRGAPLWCLKYVMTDHLMPTHFQFVLWLWWKSKGSLLTATEPPLLGFHHLRSPVAEPPPHTHSQVQHYIQVKWQSIETRWQFLLTLFQFPGCGIEAHFAAVSARLCTDGSCPWSEVPHADLASDAKMIGSPLCLWSNKSSTLVSSRSPFVALTLIPTVTFPKIKLTVIIMAAPWGEGSVIKCGLWG